MHADPVGEIGSDPERWDLAEKVQRGGSGEERSAAVGFVEEGDAMLGDEFFACFEEAHGIVEGVMIFAGMAVDEKRTEFGGAAIAFFQGTKVIDGSVALGGDVRNDFQTCGFVQFADFSGAFGAGGEIDFRAIVTAIRAELDKVTDGEVGAFPVGFGEEKVHGFEFPTLSASFDL